MLFVANANTNNLAVVNVKDPGGSGPLGFIPTGWYPTSVAGRSRWQDDLRGQRQGDELSGQPRRPEAGLRRCSARTIREYIGGLFQGTLSIIPMPDPEAHGDIFADRLRVQPVAAR